MSKDNPFSGPVETTFEYCSVCDAEHSMLDGGDIYDCWVYYRNNVEDEETKEQETMFIEDPNGNCMEIKTMKNPNILFEK